MKPYLHSSVFQVDGQQWKNQRKVLLRSQKFSVLKEHMEVLCYNSIECIKSLETLFQDGGTHPVYHQISYALLACILETLTGFRGINTKDLDIYYENHEKVETGMGIHATNIWAILFWKIHPESRRFEEASHWVNEFTKKLIQKRRCERNVSVSDAKRCVIDDLLDENYPERLMIDEINFMLGAGHETSAHTVQWFCFLLALNPEAQRKCQEEIDEACVANPDSWSNGSVSLGNMKEGLKYLDRCISESLRIFPPAYNIFRQLASPLNIEISRKPVTIPANSYISMSPLLLHRNSKYFPEPLKFDPDRFLSENVKQRHAFAYIPFSAGPRGCLGTNTAFLQVKTLAAYLVRNFVMETTDKFNDVALLPNVLMTPERPYHFRFRKRVFLE